MKISFDPRTLERWRSNNTRVVSCHLVSWGCAGQKVIVVEERVPDCTTEIPLDSSLSAWIRSSEQAVFSDAVLTHTEKWWILASWAVSSRCGCGRSFALAWVERVERSPSISPEKIQSLRDRLRKWE